MRTSREFNRKDVDQVLVHVQQHADHVKGKTLVVLAPAEGSSAVVAAAAATLSRLQMVGWLVSSSLDEKWESGDGYVASVAVCGCIPVSVRSATVALLILLALLSPFCRTGWTTPRTGWPLRLSSLKRRCRWPGGRGQPLACSQFASTGMAQLRGSPSHRGRGRRWCHPIMRGRECRALRARLRCRRWRATQGAYYGLCLDTTTRWTVRME